jgi:hypothetical protein
MVPCFMCSTMNLCSSSCSAWDSGISLPGSAAGALGLSLMAWSQMRDGGNSCDASSKNTLEYCRWCPGMLVSVGVSLGLIITLPIYSLS